MSSYKFTQYITQAVFILCFLLSFSFIEASVWENLPELPQSERIKQEEALVNNSQVQVTVYITLVSPKEAVEYYKTKLNNFGWKLETEAAQQGKNVTIFSKENKFVTISIQNILGKNYVTIAQHEKSASNPQEGSSCAECEKKQNEGNLEIPLNDAPGKDLQFVPRYPGAVRVNSIARDNGKKAILTYYVQDSVERSANFYRQNMGNYYWGLESEIDFQDLPEKLAERINTDIKGKNLVFKSASASCIISITEDPQKKGTIIGINYNEK